MSPAQRLAWLLAELDAAETVTAGRWFGFPCFKVRGKLFAVASGDALAFKLPEETRLQAMHIPGARPFDPRETGRPMKEWVQLPAGTRDQWRRFARVACAYVAGAAEALKRSLIEGLVNARKELMAEVAKLGPAGQAEAFIGEWGVRELLAHLVGWDYTNLDAVAAIRAGEQPAFWQFYDRDWATYNARLVQEHRRDDPAAMIAAVEASHQALIAALEAIPADDFARYKKIATLLRAESSDEAEHGRQVRDFRRNPAGQ